MTAEFAWVSIIESAIDECKDGQITTAQRDQLLSGTHKMISEAQWDALQDFCYGLIQDACITGDVTLFQLFFPHFVDRSYDTLRRMFILLLQHQVENCYEVCPIAVALLGGFKDDTFITVAINCLCRQENACMIRELFPGTREFRNDVAKALYAWGVFGVQRLTLRYSHVFDPIIQTTLQELERIFGEHITPVVFRYLISSTWHEANRSRWIPGANKRKHRSLSCPDESGSKKRRNSLSCPDPN